MANVPQPVIDGLKKEVIRLEKIAARFKKSHSVHHETVQGLIRSLNIHIESMEARKLLSSPPKAVTIDRSPTLMWRTISAMKKDLSPKQVLAVPCPTCGAAPGKKCKLTTGKIRNDPHRDRRVIAKEYAPPRNQKAKLKWD